MRKIIYKALLVFVSLLLLSCTSVRNSPSVSDGSDGFCGMSSISEKNSKNEKKSKKKKIKKVESEKPEAEEAEPADNYPETIEEPEPEQPAEKKEEFIKDTSEDPVAMEETITEESFEENPEEELIDDGPTLEEPVLLEEPIKETRYERALRKAKEKEDKKRRKAEEKKAKHQKKDVYTGWVYVPKRNVKVEKGDIFLTLRGGSGTFGIYAVPETGSRRPLLTTSDDFASSFFSVRAGRQEYQLNRESGVKCEARETDYGAQLAYKVKNKFQFVADFSLMPSIATSSRIDVIRVTLYTTNLSRNTQSFAVKGVFDTMLGENTYQHFSTAARSKINSETQFTDMSIDKWVRSSNDKASIQFLLNGKGITKPKSVTLANKDILSAQADWEVSAKDQRSFSSVLAYNNSALGINWKTSYLDPLKTDVITFYISVATDDREPAGREFITNLEKGKTALPSALPESAVLSDVASLAVEVTPEETATEYHDNMPAISGDLNAVSVSAVDENIILPSDSEKSDGLVSAEPVNLSEGSEEPVDSARLVSDSAVTPKPVEKQYDPEYIQDLLDRIAELENDTALIDRAEIDRLNAELDVILSQLRSME